VFSNRYIFLAGRLFEVIAARIAIAAAHLPSTQ